MNGIRIIHFGQGNSLTGIFKSLLPALAILLLNFGVSAQTAPAESLKELLLNLQKSKADTNKINLQLKLGSYYLFKPGEFKNDLDSANNFFKQAELLSSKLHQVDWQYRTLALIGNYYVEAGNLERCKQCLMQVIAHYHQQGNISKEAETWRLLGDCYTNNGKNDHLEEQISYYQHAHSLFLQNHQLLKATNLLKYIANTQICNKKFDLAESELKQVLAQYRSLGWKQLQDTYNMLYNLEYLRGNYYRAMTYCLEGIRSMKAGRDTAFAGEFYYEIGKCNYIVKNYQEALQWTRKAIAADKGSLSLLHHNYLLIQIRLALDRPEELRSVLNYLERGKISPDFTDTLSRYILLAFYYQKINKNDLAVRYYRKILELDIGKQTDEDSRNAWIMMCDNNIAEIYLKAHKPEKAKKYLVIARQTIKNAKTSVQPQYLSAFYLNSYKYNLAVGNYLAAVKSLEQNDRIKDSLFTTDKDNKIAELNIEYQTAQKEQFINNLRSQSRAQQASLEKANLQRNITIGGIFFVSLASGLFYVQYSQKQKANRLINQQNIQLKSLVTDKDLLLVEKDWLLKEVHHRVKNNLQIVMSLLRSQASYLENKDAVNAIIESQNRVHAISLIHQSLYKDNERFSVDMAPYISDLINNLKDSFDTYNRKIRFVTDAEQFKIDIVYAVPLGLILNEAITNAIKYAFDEAGGTIIISMKKNKANMVKMEVSDNGKGIDPHFELTNADSLGMEMMKGLSKQVGGYIHIRNNNGTILTVEYPLKNVAPLSPSFA